MAGDKALITDSADGNKTKQATVGSFPISTATQTALDGKETKAVVQASAPADTTVDWYDTDQESGVLVLKRHNGTTWVRASSHGVQYASNCAGITAGMCVDTDDGKLYYHNNTAVVEVGTSGGSYTLPTASADTLGGVKVGSRLTIIDGVLSADVQSGSALPTWMPSVGPTNGRQILQATGGCSLSAYDNQADCQTNSGTWITPTYQHTSIISGLINDTGTADDDLWSAAQIISELSGKQASLGFTAENSALKGAANGYAGLGSDGKVPSSQLPTLGTAYSLPSLADAQAGASTTPYVWSPQRVAQAIAALAPSGGAGEGYYEIDGGSSASLTFTGDIDGGASI